MDVWQSQNRLSALRNREKSICLLPFQSIDEVVSGLTDLEDFYANCPVGRGPFVTAYRVISEVIRDWIEKRRFQCSHTAERYVVSFANRYRTAVYLMANGEIGRVPTPWLHALNSKGHSTTSWLDDLLLGINAHINFDLPFAVLDAGLDVYSPSHYSDHIKVNSALRCATPVVRRIVLAKYEHRTAQRFAGKLLGGWFDTWTNREFVLARQKAWVWAKALTQSDSRSHPMLIRDLANQTVERAERLKSCSLMKSDSIFDLRGFRRRVQLLCLAAN